MRAVAAVAMLALPALAAGQDARFELFNECRPMMVVVDVSRAEWVDEQGILEMAREELQELGLYDPVADAALQLTVAATELGEAVAYAHAARYLKPVRDSVTGITKAAPTWIGGGVGLGDQYAGIGITVAVADDILQFVSEYGRVNEAACD